MASALAMDTQQVALELHEVLRDLDPARWRDDLDASVRERLAAISDHLALLVERTWPDDSLAALQTRLADVRDLLYQYAPAEGVTTDDARQAWMELAANLRPAYERLAAALRDEGTHVPSLRPTNYVRNAYHVANGLFIIGMVQYVIVTKPAMWAVATGGFLAAWTLEISRRLDPRVNTFLMRLFGPVAHPHEAWRVNSATWYATAILVLAWCFSPEVGVAALAVLTIGDPTAAMVGRRIGRTELIGGRTLEGSVGFVVAGGAAAAIALALFYPAPIELIIARALAASVAGAVAELLTRRVDDNLAIPVAAAAAGALVRFLGF